MLMHTQIIKIVVIFAVYFRTVVRVLVQFSPKSPELRTGPNWTNTSGSSDRTELDYAARASNWTELDQPPRLARTMVRSGPSRALVPLVWGATLRAGQGAAGGEVPRCRGGGFRSKKLAELSKVRVQVARRYRATLLAV